MDENNNDSHEKPDANPAPPLSAEFLSGGTAAGLEKIRARLLDITNRNRLLNFRHTSASSIRIVDADPNAVFARLVNGEEIPFRPVPEPILPPEESDTDRSDDENDMTHPLVTELFEGGKCDTITHAEEHPIDAPELKHELPPLIVDADSSQHSALIDAMRGQNLVIEGPPGTGKSQTITNLMAAALVSGKTVLFVSEKLAAREVVRRRLDEAGLGMFCLELHSHKTRKDCGTGFGGRSSKTRNGKFTVCGQRTGSRAETRRSSGCSKRSTTCWTNSSEGAPERRKTGSV